ncbi:MAG: VanW family protein [Eubacteriales bacterium]|nr:VanW family protein [Eubacteriales bacterium]
MSKGKFSNPRPYRDEEREIEQAFRQMTGKAPKPESRDIPDIPLNPEEVPEEYVPLDAEFPELEAEMEQPEAPEPPEDPEPPEEPDWVDKAQALLQKAVKFCGENPKIVMVVLCAVALAIIVGIMAAFFLGTSDPYGGKILNNVYIANVNVGGLTKKEAAQVLRSAADAGYSREDMVIDLAGTPLHLSPEDTGVSLDVKAAVNAAYGYGRSGSRAEQDASYQASLTTDHYIGALPYLKLDQDYIRQVLTDYAKDSGSTLTQTAYGLEGKMPELSGDKFDESAPCQTLVITMGTPGVGFDPEAVFKQVLDAYSMNQFLVTVEDISSTAEPEPLDLEAVYEELYIAPVDASVDLQTFEPLPGSYGYGFDLDEAREQVENADYGQVLRIPMEYIQPKIVGSDVLFRDVLGEYDTPLPGDSRSGNIRLALEAINGTVLNPGEEFSFNEALGERSSGKGYKSAQSDHDPDDSALGGGVDQAASTLYCSVLLADLDVTARKNHDYVPDYIDRGFDAATRWKGQDLKFKNSSAFPIRIEAEISGSDARVQILGTDERDYTVELKNETTETMEPKTDFKEFPADNDEGYENGQTIRRGVTGYRVKTYRVKYSRETGELLSKDFESNSTYEKVNKLVAVVKAPEETTEETTEATEETTVPPTETTAPPETTLPTTPSTPPEGSEGTGDGENTGDNTGNGNNGSTGNNGGGNENSNNGNNGNPDKPEGSPPASDPVEPAPEDQQAA